MRVGRGVRCTWDAGCALGSVNVEGAAGRANRSSFPRGPGRRPFPPSHWGSGGRGGAGRGVPSERHRLGPGLAAGTELRQAGQGGPPERAKRNLTEGRSGSAHHLCPVNREPAPQAKVICQSEASRPQPRSPGRLRSRMRAQRPGGWPDCRLLTGLALRGGLAWPGWRLSPAAGGTQAKLATHDR